MAKTFHHEELYRGKAAVEKLQTIHVTVCGAGALGSNLIDTLTRQGFLSMTIIDFDRVEEHNIGTQTYTRDDIGAFKAPTVRNKIFKTVGPAANITVYDKELNEGNVKKFLKGAALVLDVFDNGKSRQIVQNACRENHWNLLHVGLYEDYAEIIWDEKYKVPKDVVGDVCDYPLARNLIMLAVSVAAEEVQRFALGKKTANWTITLKDYAVRPFDN